MMNPANPTNDTQLTALAPALNGLVRMIEDNDLQQTVCALAGISESRLEQLKDGDNVNAPEMLALCAAVSYLYQNEDTEALAAADTCAKDLAWAWMAPIYVQISRKNMFLNSMVKASGLDDQQAFLSSYHLFMDATVLCSDDMPAFLDNLFAALEQQEKPLKITVPHCVILSLKEMSEDPAVAELLGTKKGLVQLQRIQEAGLLSVRGDESDSTIMSTFISAFSRFKPTNSLALLTEDEKIAQSVIKLNDLGIEGGDILVARLLSDGVARMWGEEEEEAEVGYAFQPGNDVMDAFEDDDEDTILVEDEDDTVDFGDEAPTADPPEEDLILDESDDPEEEDLILDESDDPEEEDLLLDESDNPEEEDLLLDESDDPEEEDLILDEFDDSDEEDLVLVEPDDPDEEELIPVETDDSDEDALISWEKPGWDDSDETGDVPVMFEDAPQAANIAVPDAATKVYVPEMFAEVMPMDAPLDDPTCPAPVIEASGNEIEEDLDDDENVMKVSDLEQLLAINSLLEVDDVDEPEELYDGDDDTQFEIASDEKEVEWETSEVSPSGGWMPKPVEFWEAEVAAEEDALDDGLQLGDMVEDDEDEDEGDSASNQDGDWESLE